MADNQHTVLQEELGPDGFVVRDAVPTSDVIRIRFADIDGLRALAIALVAFSVLVHYAMQAPSALALRLAAAASQGVSLFFVISGFALAFPAMAVLRQDGRTYIDVGRYTLRRLMRVYPAYLTALLLSVVVASLVGKFAIVPGLRGANPASFLANVFFAGDGFGNDGFRVLGLFLRAYIFFPTLAWLWTRRPIAFAGIAVACAILDLLTPAHAWSIGAFVPFMLGIVAADLRAQVHRFERIAPIIAVVSALVAIVAGPFMTQLPGYAFAPNAINVDPFWSLCAFGLVVSAAAYRPLENFFSFWLFRLIGAASFPISLVLVPVAGLLAATFPYYGVLVFLPLAFVVAFPIWQFVDRGFNDSMLRRNFAAEHAGPIDEALSKVRADRVFLGGPPPLDSDDEDDLPDAHQEEFVPNFYAPPPRASAADLAIVSRRTGSPEELQNAILETKARLQERSAALFAEDEALKNAVPPPVFAKPGFYRKPTKQTDGDDAAGLEPLVGGAVSGPASDDEPLATAQPPSEEHEPGVTVKHTISAKPAAAPGSPAPPAAAMLEEPAEPEQQTEPEQPANGKGPAIRIRISTPNDGVMKNG